MKKQNFKHIAYKFNCDDDKPFFEIMDKNGDTELIINKYNKKNCERLQFIADLKDLAQFATELAEELSP